MTSKLLSFLVLAVLASGGTIFAVGHKPVESVPNPAQLELTSEIAATTQDGRPAALRITVKNAGNLAVDLPMPQSSCVPGGGGVSVQYEWHPNDPQDHTGGSGGIAGCSQDHFPALTNRVRNEWIRLQPGEFITVSTNLRDEFRDLKPGKVEYWVEYTPPEVKPSELLELQKSGFIVPTERVKTSRQAFTIN